jgi:mRNA interferase MazF
MEKFMKGAEQSKISGTFKNVTFLKGDVVVIPFPFSDLTAVKKRPALVVASLRGDDLILCQITSKTRTDDYSIILFDKDFAGGTLNLTSLIKPNRLFTADKSLIERKVGFLKKNKINTVIDKVCKILRS